MIYLSAGIHRQTVELHLRVCLHGPEIAVSEGVIGTHCAVQTAGNQCVQFGREFQVADSALVFAEGLETEEGISVE